MKKKTPSLIPNIALQQVREATGLTQDGFSNLVDFSRAYIQAVELGQRDASEDLVHRTTVMTGVWPHCISEKWSEAVDFNGDRYTSASYRRFKSAQPVADEVSADEIDGLLDPAKRVIAAAAKRGKANIAFYYMWLGLVEATHNLLWMDSKIARELSGGDKPIGCVTMGRLRADPVLAAAVGFVDDPRLPDEKEIPLQAPTETLNASDLFPSAMVPNPGKKYSERLKAADATRGEADKAGSADRQK